MPLHPQARAMIEAYSPDPDLDYRHLDAAQLRASFAIPEPAAPPRADVLIETLRAPGPAGPIALRLYRPVAAPSDASALPITVYLHGGGFVLGSPDTTDGLCRSLAAWARTLVVSVDYRLAPEAPFPAGLDDAYAALCWVARHAGEFGGDGERIAIAGDSSGGNFAAALAQCARSDGPGLRHQLLLYPVLDAACAHPSYREFAEGYFLSAPMMQWYWRQYLDGADPADPRVSPLRAADLRGLPSATVFSAEYDVLRDEAEAYAQALIAAGVPVNSRRWDGQIHGFLLQQGRVDAADTALAQAAAALRAAFA
ncbi:MULTISPECIES: alpha/beta hydrolase [Lysobacter]|uniref:alpha/beta hydrolase n=1 Tax=Lysobacter TaxID=68 RepID=UPI001F29CA8C|nr:MULTISPECIES: alpha/beta hydrolase [Lysobacter]UJB17180.1 alpha/beta hydrolase [Lysobacter capsici]UJQ29097.1 alpha/beta hydrolase [Lysobacter gummosus]